MKLVVGGVVDNGSCFWEMGGFFSGNDGRVFNCKNEI